MKALATKANSDLEKAVAKRLGELWKCKFLFLGHLSSTDRIVVRDGRPVAVAEIKCRSHDADRYPTVFMALRKWYELTRVAAALEIAAYYIVRFEGGEVRYIDVRTVDPRGSRMWGRAPREGAPHDQELIFEIPVEDMEIA